MFFALCPATDQDTADQIKLWSAIELVQDAFIRLGALCELIPDAAEKLVWVDQPKMQYQHDATLALGIRRWMKAVEQQAIRDAEADVIALERQIAANEPPF